MDISAQKRMAITNTNPYYIHGLKSIVKTLQTGEVSLKGQVISGSNYTFLVSVNLNGALIDAIYKPIKGERPLWDFPDHSLAKREVAAFIIASLLGWQFVPPTILRSEAMPYGIGSLQLFIPHDPEINFFNLPLIGADTIQKIITFDFIINNADRKGGHLLLDNQNEIWLIDHGLAFNTEFKLRTVIWDYAGLPIPKILLMDIQKLTDRLKSNKSSLVLKLKTLLNEYEILKIISRSEELLSNPEFPKPSSKIHSFPWPPV